MDGLRTCGGNMKSGTGQNQRQSPEREEGFSLIATAFLVLAIGMFMVGGSRLYTSYSDYHRDDITETRMNDIQSALQNFYVKNGRYPCAASLTAPIDDAAFGIEVSTDCTAGAIAGTQRAAGDIDGKMVRTGAIPVRTLGLPDSMSFDGYDNRYLYAITEENAVDGVLAPPENGDIRIIDAGNNDATAIAGNVIQIVYSMGPDMNGAFNRNGINVQPCDITARTGENCDFASNANFLNTVEKSYSTNPANRFTHKISYTPNKPLITCNDTGPGVLPGDVGFIVDTSGSMDWAGTGSDGFNVQCPASMPGCSRIDVARWAMRRVMPAIIHNKHLKPDPGQTSMTGFVGYNNLANVKSNLGNILFDDPSAAGYTQPDDTTIAVNLETELQGMCPTGSTPLGLHIRALADRLGDGTPTRPNKITVLSDGVSNNGMDPVAAANHIRVRYPNLQVDIIDVVGNSSLRQVSDLTGGRYFRTDNPDDLLDSLFASAGICTPFTPPGIVDQQGCGSKGGWWLSP